MMKTNSKVVFGGFAFIFFVLSVAIYSFIYESSETQKMTAETDAEILEVERKYSLEYNQIEVYEETQGVKVKFRYEINRQTYERMEVLPPNALKIFKVGEKAKVCYNPSNFNEVKLFQSEYICGK